MDLKEAILARVDIVELIGQYVSLIQAGREFKAPCPFHEETAASFHVNPEKGLYHCFGCKAGGNVISFVMQMENLEFREALEWLADRYKIEVPRSEGERVKRGAKERLYDLNEAALKFFRKSLKAPAGETALKYLARRGIGDRQIADFDLGYAPREWNALTDLLLSRGARTDELVTLGLIKPRRGDGPALSSGDRNHYDAFRHRLIFPIRGVTGRVIGFAGRVLSDEDKPKYLNVTNTPLYDKSGVLYNLDRAKGVLREEGAVVVEGYMDVIGLASAGVTNTVATCGTALTSEHVRLLRKYTDRFYLAFDGDLAGAKAAWSAGILFLREGLDVQVIALPEGVDPDDLAREKGREAWLGLLGEAVSVVRFWLNHQRRQFPDPDLATQRRWIQQLGPLYRDVPDELVRQQFLREAAGVLRLGAAEVAGLLAGVSTATHGEVRIKRGYKPQAGQRPQDFLAPGLYPREGGLVERLLTDQQIDKQHRTVAARQHSVMRGSRAIEREVIRRVLDDEAFRMIYLAIAGEEPVADWFADQRFRGIFTRLLAGEDANLLIHDDELNHLCSEILVAEPFLDTDEQLLARHKLEHLRKEFRGRMKEVNEASNSQQWGDVSKILKTITSLDQEIKKLESKLAGAQPLTW